MLCRVVLCFAVLCCAVVCDGVLCCAVLCCAVLCCAVLCCAVLCCAVLCCVLLCCAVLCCAVLCCAVLCCAVLCCVVSCYVFLVTSLNERCLWKYHEVVGEMFFFCIQSKKCLREQLVFFSAKFCLAWRSWKVEDHRRCSAILKIRTTNNVKFYETCTGQLTNDYRRIIKCDPIIGTLKSLLTELNSRTPTLTPNPNDPRTLTPHLMLIFHCPYHRSRVRTYVLL